MTSTASGQPLNKIRSPEIRRPNSVFSETHLESNLLPPFELVFREINFQMSFGFRASDFFRISDFRASDLTLGYRISVDSVLFSAGLSANHQRPSADDQFLPTSSKALTCCPCMRRNASQGEQAASEQSSPTRTLNMGLKCAWFSFRARRPPPVARRVHGPVEPSW